MFLANLAEGALSPSLWMLGPFCLLLVLIALAPVAFHRFWEKYHAAVSVGLGLITASYYIFSLHRIEPLIHALREYFSFLALIGSLFVVSGGIVIRVRGEATPAENCLFLFVGSLLANVFGTTGASMLLIRPWIRMNKYRVTGFHVVFFIFLVSNIGGGLTPIGDPPLFLGFLKGVPFWWPLQACWKPWLLSVILLLGVFYVLDRRNFKRAPLEIREKQTREEHWRIEGWRNVFLSGVLLGAMFLPFGWRELVMIGCAVLAWKWTARSIHEANHFDFAPVKEVGWLFVGIFLTMLPALEVLGMSASTLGLKTPGQWFWATGILSGLLDNAPTYLAFLAAAFGWRGLHLDTQMPEFVSQHGELLRAISLGAVFFGAITYIGNGPNLMVKQIAEQQRVNAPSFLEYVWKYSLPILVPLFVLISHWFLPVH